MRILAVDDSVSIRMIIARVLGEAGFQVDLAPDGLQALAMLSSEHRLVIVDYHLPGMNGAELIQSIRHGAVNCAVPILVVTTECADKPKLEVRHAGATGWITKPFDPPALAALARKLAAGREF